MKLKALPTVYFFLFWLIPFLAVKADNSVSASPGTSGTVIDSLSKKPVDYASISVYDQASGKLITEIITKPLKNMKDLNISQADKILLRKRAISEYINDKLKNICKLQHIRHRSVNNFLMNTMSALCVYHFFPKKPSLNIVFQTNDNQLLLTA